jgi:hypothetical protein
MDLHLKYESVEPSFRARRDPIAFGTSPISDEPQSDLGEAARLPNLPVDYP